MRELLISLKFIKTHDCKCGGTLKETWQSCYYSGVGVEIKPNAGFFEIWCSKVRGRVRGREEEFEGELLKVLKTVNEKNLLKMLKEVQMHTGPQTGVSVDRCADQKRGTMLATR